MLVSAVPGCPVAAPLMFEVSNRTSHPSSAAAPIATLPGPPTTPPLTLAWRTSGAGAVPPGHASKTRPQLRRPGVVRDSQPPTRRFSSNVPAAAPRDETPWHAGAVVARTVALRRALPGESTSAIPRLRAPAWPAATSTCSRSIAANSERRPVLVSVAVAGPDAMELRSALVPSRRGLAIVFACEALEVALERALEAARVDLRREGLLQRFERAHHAAGRSWLRDGGGNHGNDWLHGLGAASRLRRGRGAALRAPRGPARGAPPSACPRRPARAGSRRRRRRRGRRSRGAR